MRGGTTPHPTLAVEDNLFIGRGFLESESILELVGWEHHGVGLGLDGDVDCVGDVAGGVLGGLADICNSYEMPCQSFAIDAEHTYQDGALLGRLAELFDLIEVVDLRV